MANPVITDQQVSRDYARVRGVAQPAAGRAFCSLYTHYYRSGAVPGNWPCLHCLPGLGGRRSCGAWLDITSRFIPNWTKNRKASRVKLFQTILICHSWAKPCGGWQDLLPLSNSSLAGLEHGEG